MACPLLSLGSERVTGDNEHYGTRLSMDTFSPEFSSFWLQDAGSSSERVRAETAPGHENLSPAQQVALEELCERVNAARSVV